jgi:hypothetical protein
MWRNLVSGLFPDAKFGVPAAASALEHAERELHVSFPEELRSLLLETNGVKAHYSTPLVWPVEEMISQNQLFRTNADFAELFMPFDSLLFFGDGGNGDQFGYRILGGRIRDTSFIYKWDHEGDDRVWFATDLPDYFRRSVPADE